MELIWKLKDLHSDDWVLQEPNLKYAEILEKKLNFFHFTIFIITNWPA